jgi:GNAT superfamily N-acetyltransferase
MSPQVITLRPGDTIALGGVIRRLDDVDEAREIHALAFPADEWVGDEHEFWVAYDGQGVAGFASAVFYVPPDGKTVFLSRAAVVKRAAGMGLHKSLISARVLWAWEQGADRCVTYTTMRNYASMVNLLDSGFRFYVPALHCWWYGKHVHYYEKVRTHG